MAPCSPAIRENKLLLFVFLPGASAGHRPVPLKAMATFHLLVSSPLGASITLVKHQRLTKRSVNYIKALAKYGRRNGHQGKFIRHKSQARGFVIRSV